MGARAAVVCSLVALLASGSAFAQGVSSARLEYIVGAGAAGCPDEREIRDAVATRLGRDPFADSADTTARTTIQRVGRGYRARVEILDSSGRIVRSREINSPHADCREIAASITLTISIAIDPMSIMGAPPPASPAPPVPIVPPAPPPSLPTPPAPEPPPRVATTAALTEDPALVPSDPWRVVVRIGAVGSAGVTPGVAFGPLLAVGILRNRIALELEASLAFSPWLVDGPAGGRASALQGMIEPVICYRAGALRLCGVGALGALVGTGRDLPVTRSQTSVVAGIGPRVAFDVALSRLLFLSAHAELLVALASTTLQLNGADAWTTSPVWFTAALSLGLRLP